jgi:hypothetical protein
VALAQVIAADITKMQLREEAHRTSPLASLGALAASGNMENFLWLG